MENDLVHRDRYESLVPRVPDRFYAASDVDVTQDHTPENCTVCIRVTRHHRKADRSISLFLHIFFNAKPVSRERRKGEITSLLLGDFALDILSLDPVLDRVPQFIQMFIEKVSAILKFHQFSVSIRRDLFEQDPQILDRTEFVVVAMDKKDRLAGGG
jgi:hypothetical protein